MPRRTGAAILILGIGAIGASLMNGSVSCSGSQAESVEGESPRPVPKGDRILAVKVNIGEEGNFDEAFREALQAGNETFVLPQDWNELETAPGVFEPEVNFLAIANGFYPARGMPIHLVVRPVHTHRKVVPADLMGTPLDDPRTIERFERLLDWIATQIPDVELTSLVIGSEVDILAWGDPARWEEWIRFYAAVAPCVRERFPGTLVSCETTHAAFVGPDLERVRRLHRYSDAIGVSYYPMAPESGNVRAPTVVHADFDLVVGAVAHKPIIFYQIGYPSSPALGSSVDRQAEFLVESFRAWDRHAGRIRMLQFQWMHETPGFGLDHYAAYYGYDTPSFRAFLGSLGLQQWSGEPKPAWEALTQEAKARGFGNPSARTRP